jgi:peptidoglycan/LPS O-acetylase OafA/YrhL
MGNKQASKRVYSIDFLRVIASCFIVLYHYQIFGGYFRTGQLNFVGGRFNFSTMVEFFFICAGFFELSVERCADTGFKKFFLPKVIRLIPQIAFSVLFYEGFAVLLNSLNGDSTYNVSFFGSVITILCLHGIGIFENPFINGATWFVSVLLLCHILYFLLVKLCKKIRISPLIPFALMIALGLVLKIVKIELPLLCVYTGRGYSMFFLGCIMGETLLTEKATKFLRKWEPVLWIVVAASLFLHLSDYAIPGKGWLLIFIVYPGLFLLFYFGRMRDLLKAPVLESLGNITYDVYVWHASMLLLFGILLHYCPCIDVSGYLVAFLFVAFMFLWSALVYRFVDKPLTDLLKRKLL